MKTVIRPISLRRAVLLMAAVVILKVTAEVVIGYRNYFPPDFNADFLRGRDRYFFGSYQWAFYPHVASGPVSLVLGMLLISDRFRGRFPEWHRLLGRVQVPLIVAVVAPSGFWMALHAAAGPVAAVGFAVLALLTGLCAALGWKMAVQRRFAEHRRWMWRCFLLLCSAVVIRVVGGLATVSGVQVDWLDSVMSWASWLVPLTIYELSRRVRHRAVVIPVTANATIAVPSK